MRPTAFALVTVGALAYAPMARAEQVILADVRYVHDSTTTTDSHFRMAPSVGTPSDWTRPVDFSQGSVFVRLDVKTKPSGDAPTRFQICFEGTPSYACTDQSPVYTRTGTYAWTTPFSRFYIGNGVNVDWAKGASKLALILKDDKNVKPAPENVGSSVSSKYMPSEVHVLVALLSAGATYLPPEEDAGAPDGSVVHPAMVDASTPMPFDAPAPAVQAPHLADGSAANAASDASAQSYDAAAQATPEQSAASADASGVTEQTPAHATGCQAAAPGQPLSGPLWVLAMLSILARVRRGGSPELRRRARLGHGQRKLSGP